MYRIMTHIMHSTGTETRGQLHTLSTGTIAHSVCRLLSLALRHLLLLLLLRQQLLLLPAACCCGCLLAVAAAQPTMLLNGDYGYGSHLGSPRR